MKPLISTKPKSIVDLLSDRDRRFLENVFPRNRAVFGDLRMDAGTPPAPAPPAPAPAPPSPTPTPPVDPPKGDDWDASKGAGGKEAVLADLKKARAEAAAAAKERDALKAKVDEAEQAKLSDLEKANKAAEAANARAERAERTALVNEVALAKGLPAVLARRLTGATKEELERDADDLIALIPAAPAGPKAPAPDPSQGGGSEPVKTKTLEGGRSRYQERHKARTS